MVGSEPVDEIDAKELERKLSGEGERPFLLDVREPYEWEIANLGDRGAELIPMRELPDRLDELPEGREIVVYCRSGDRSAHVVRYLQDRGVERAVNLEGGILAWAHEVDPSLETY